MPRKAAFFDVDGTLVKGYIPPAFSDYLAGKGVLDRKKNERIQELIGLYKEGKASYRYVSLRVPKLYASGIKGRRHSEIVRLASVFMKEYKKNLFPYSKRLVSLMNRKGFLTVAISGAQIEVLTYLDMGFRGIHGVEVWVRNGICTGKIKRNLILAEEKRRVINSLVRKYGIDMENSFAFGDSEEDLAMLSRVGNPVPLNPTPLLREYALKKGWCVPEDVLKEVNYLLKGRRMNPACL